MNQEEDYRKEVILISLERDNKRLLDIYREGEEKNNLSSMHLRMCMRESHMLSLPLLYLTGTSSRRLKKESSTSLRITIMITFLHLLSLT